MERRALGRERQMAGERQPKRQLFRPEAGRRRGAEVFGKRQRPGDGLPSGRRTVQFYSTE